MCKGHICIIIIMWPADEVTELNYRCHLPGLIQNAKVLFEVANIIMSFLLT